MAAPPSVTIKNLTGNWIMDKDLSDDSEPVLSLQGVNWLTRKAIGKVSIGLKVVQTTKDNGIVNITIDQSAAGLSGTREVRDLNWEKSEHSDHIFGTVNGRSRWINIENIKEPLPDDFTYTDEEIKFLSEGWIDSDSENGGPNGERLIESFAVNTKDNWIARQIWGFAMVNGSRYYVRRTIVKQISGKKDAQRVRLVYSYKPE